MLFTMCGVAEELPAAETHEEPAPVVTEQKQEPTEAPEEAPEAEPAPASEEAPVEAIEESIEEAPEVPAEGSEEVPEEVPAEEPEQEPVEESREETELADCETRNTDDDCTHPNRYQAAQGVVNFQEKATDNGDGTHTGLANIYDIDICPDCGRNLYVLKEENVQATGSCNYYEGVCEICGAESRCSHENHTLIGPALDYKDIKVNEDNTHTRTIREGNLYSCDDCNEYYYVWGDWGEPVTSSHVWRENGICNDCNATNTCEHPNKTETEKYDVYSATRIDDTWHEESGYSYTLVECKDCGLSIVTNGQDYNEDRAHSYPNGVCVCGACVHVHRYADYREEWGDFSNPIDNGDGTHTLTYQPMSSAYCPDCGAEGLVGQYAVPYGKSEPMSEKHSFGEDGFCRAGCGAENKCEHTSTREESYYECDRKEFFDLTKKTHSLNRYECSSTYCADCNTLLEQDRKPAGVTVEPHSYDPDGICSSCGMDSSEQCEHENTILTYRYEGIGGGQKVYAGLNGHAEICLVYADRYCTDCGRSFPADEMDDMGVYQVVTPHSIDAWGSCTECGSYIDAHHLDTAAREDRSVEAVIERGESTHTVRYSIGKQDICTFCGAEVGGRYDITTVEKTEAHDFSNGICRACGAENSCEHSSTATEQRNDRIHVSLETESHTQIDQPISVTYCKDCGEVLSSERVGEPTQVVSPHRYVTEGGVQYCESCGYFRATVECRKHTYKKVPGVDATCTVAGYKAYYACSVCGTPKAEPEMIPAKGHTEQVIPEQPATCLIHGYSEYVVCSVCQEVLVGGEIIFAPGYHVQVTDPAVEPDCITVGYTAGSHCEVCGEILVEQQELGYGDHSYEDAECVVCGRIADVEHIEFMDSTIELGVKDTYRIEASVTPSKAADQLVYYSSNPSVAKVDGNGLVTALKPGYANIYAKAGGIYQCLNVEVIAGISKLVLSSKTLQTEIGRSETLSVDVTGYSNNELTWTSSAPSIVEITEADEDSVKLVGRQVGTAIIKVQASNGKSATCKVTVVDPTKLVSVKLYAEDSMLLVGNDTVFHAETLPTFESEDGVTVTFRSSNPKVMTVDEKTGSAHGLAAGTVTVTATAVQGKIKKTASMKMMVIAPDKVQAIFPDNLSAKLGMELDEESTTVFNCNPSTASVTYSVTSSKPTVVAATMEGSRLFLRAVGVGTAKITVTGVDATGAKKTYVSTITVFDPYAPKAVILEVSDQLPLSATEAVVYAAVDTGYELISASEYDVVWKSSNPSIASVDQEGMLTLYKAGKVTITATVTYGKIKKTGKATIQIQDPDTLSSVAFDGTAIEGCVGGRKQLEFFVYPWTLDFDTLDIAFTSSNPKLATVDECGVVELLAPGTVTITMTATQGKIKKTAKIKITITPARSPA